MKLLALLFVLACLLGATSIVAVAGMYDGAAAVPNRAHRIHAGTIDANAGRCAGSTGACNSIYINEADFYQLAPGGGYYVHIGSGSGWHVDRYAPYNTSGFVSVCTNYGCKSHGFSGAGNQSFTVWF